MIKHYLFTCIAIFFILTCHVRKSINIERYECNIEMRYDYLRQGQQEEFQFYCKNGFPESIGEWMNFYKEKGFETGLCNSLITHSDSVYRYCSGPKFSFFFFNESKNVYGELYVSPAPCTDRSDFEGKFVGRIQKSRIPNQPEPWHVGTNYSDLEYTNSQLRRDKDISRKEKDYCVASGTIKIIDE